MDLQLNDKLALVSASSSGIGYAIALQLAREGARVILNGRTQQTVEAALQRARSEPGHANLLPLVADLGTASGVQSALERFPQVDILVNNLGVYWSCPFEESSDEDWLRMLEINLMSGVRLTRHYFPKMLAANWGRVLFISSESGIMVPSEMIHYGVSKSAQLSLASGLARLTKGTGVTVNSVLPGPTQTDNVLAFMRNLMPDRAQAEPEELGRAVLAEHRPSSLLGRLIRPEEVASLVAYLASPLAAATNGAAVRVEGGLVQAIQ